MSKEKSPYYYLNSSHAERILLYSLLDPEDLIEEEPDDFSYKDNSWVNGKAIVVQIPEPIKIKIQDEDVKRLEEGDPENIAVLLDYFDGQNLVSKNFYETMIDAGVENLIAYDAIIESRDQSIQYKGYKVMNVIGGLIQSDDKNGFRASAKLSVVDNDPNNFNPHKLLIFRAKNGELIFHEKLKDALEVKGIKYLKFFQPSAWN